MIGLACIELQIPLLLAPVDCPPGVIDGSKNTRQKKSYVASRERLTATSLSWAPSWTVLGFVSFEGFPNLCARGRQLSTKATNGYAGSRK